MILDLDSRVIECVSPHATIPFDDIIEPISVTHSEGSKGYQVTVVASSPGQDRPRRYNL